MQALYVAEGLNVIYGTLLLALIALGLAVTMGLLGVLNIAHGEFVMIGCYTAYVVQRAGLPYAVSIVAAVMVCGILGLIVERFVIRPLRYDPFETLLATWGVGQLLREAVALVFGRAYLSVNVPLHGSVAILGVEYPTYRVVIMVTSALILTAVSLWYARSGTAAKVRAMVGNPVLAEAVGIDIIAQSRNTFAAGAVFAGLAGVMIAPLLPVDPSMGIALVVSSFFSLVVGGMGTLAGLATGSFVIGGAQSAAAAIFNPTVAYLGMLGLSIFFLWRKPRGIFPRP